MEVESDNKHIHIGHQTIIYASFLQRLAASIIDSLFISIITLFFQSLFGFNPFAYFSTANSPEQLKQLQASPSYIISNLANYVIYFFYLIIFWTAYDGATPGKRLLGIQIKRENYKKVGFAAAFVRIIGMVFSMLVLGLGYLWVIWDQKKQAWHDKLAKTIVIRSAKQTNKILIAILLVISIIYHVALIGAGLMLGFSASRSDLKGKIQTRESLTSIKQATKKISPEAKVHLDRSQELFAKIRETSNDPAKVRTLNDENIAEIKKALEIEPGNALLWNNLGNAYTWVSSTGTLEDGLAAYGKAEELEPENIYYMTSVGDMLYRLGKYQDAVLQLQKVLRISDNYAYPEYLIGSSYKELKIYDQARPHLEKAIEIYTKYNSEGEFDDDILQAQQQLAGIPK